MYFHSVLYTLHLVLLIGGAIGAVSPLIQWKSSPVVPDKLRKLVFLVGLGMVVVGIFVQP